MTPLPLEGLTVVSLEQAVAAPFCDAAVRRPGRPRDQGRTRHRRLRPGLRRQSPWYGELLRLAEPQQGIHSAGP